MLSVARLRMNACDERRYLTAIKQSERRSAKSQKILKIAVEYGLGREKREAEYGNKDVSTASGKLDIMRRTINLIRHIGAKTAYRTLLQIRGHESVSTV